MDWNQKDIYSCVYSLVRCHATGRLFRNSITIRGFSCCTGSDKRFVVNSDESQEYVTPVNFVYSKRSTLSVNPSSFSNEFITVIPIDNGTPLKKRHGEKFEENFVALRKSPSFSSQSVQWNFDITDSVIAYRPTR